MERRAVVLCLIMLLLAGGTVGYGAVPQSTIRTSGGITTYVGHYVNATLGYYMGGTRLVDSGGNAVFATLDTGQGANELYAMDQPVRTSDSPTFANLTLSGDYLNGYNVTEALKYPEQPASYIIFTDGSTIYAKNGTTGEIEFSGADATTVIQNAINQLSNGMIFIKRGTYDLSGVLSLDDNTIIVGESAEDTILQHYGLKIPAGKSNILVSNIRFDKAGSAQTLAIYAYDGVSNLTIAKCTFDGYVYAFQPVLPTGNETFDNIIIEDSVISNMNATHESHAAISLFNCRNSKALNNRITNVGSRGIAVGGLASDVLISGNYIENSGLNYNDKPAIYVGFTRSDFIMRNVIVSNNVIVNYNNNYITHGIVVSGETATDRYGYGIVIEGNTIFDNQTTSKKGTAIYLHGFSGGGATFNVRGVTVIGNTIYTPLKGITVTLSRFNTITSNVIEKPFEYGILLSAGAYNTISGNIIRNPSQKATNTYDGLRIEGVTPTHNSIIGNIIFDDDNNMAYGVRELADGDYNYNFIGFNSIGGAVTASVLVNGTETRVKNNIGFITENSGTATIANGTSSVQVAHGLAGTPTVVVLGPTHSEVADAVWSADATYITITVPSAVTADRDISWYAEYTP